MKFAENVPGKPLELPEDPSTLWPESALADYVLTIPDQGFTEKAHVWSTSLPISLRHRVNKGYLFQQIRGRAFSTWRGYHYNLEDPHTGFLNKIARVMLETPMKPSNVILCGTNHLRELGFEIHYPGEWSDEEIEDRGYYVTQENGRTELRHKDGKVWRIDYRLDGRDTIPVRPDDWSFSGLIFEEGIDTEKRSLPSVIDRIGQADMRLQKMLEEDENYYKEGLKGVEDEVRVMVEKDLDRRGLPLEKRVPVLKISMKFEFVGESPEVH